MKQLLILSILAIAPKAFAQLYISNDATLYVAHEVFYTNEDVVNEGTLSFAENKAINFTIDAGLNNSQGNISFNDATLVIGSGGNNASGTDTFVFNTNDAVKYVILNKDQGIANVTAGHLGIAETFKLESGTLNAADKVTLLNTNANQTAYVIESVGGSANLAVEKFYPEQRAYRLVTSPVSGGSIFDNWQNGGFNQPGSGTHITGETGAAGAFNPASGIDYSQSGEPSLLSLGSDGWQAVLNTKDTNIEAAAPYLFLIRGDRTIDLENDNAPPTATTLTTVGDLQVGNLNITFPLLRFSPQENNLLIIPIPQTVIRSFVMFRSTLMQ